ncbi:RDD family protein [Cellulomonas sp. S1-8]|uniref:RDD family protein n=1 Tax=Cellulomonas sp. S1-8 TaxID=2904790 RepID=UPI00224301D5|nr:RDD family protein [Cellulomonas sp. S1-8]UZN02528.1 RDD family protein [Cellulomonas sp. S1-8]
MTTTLPLPATTDVVMPQLASWGRRVVAALLDSAVLGAVAWFAVGDEVAAPSLQPTFDSAGPDATLPWTSSGVLVGAWLALLVLQGLTGQTPGRRVLGIEVVRAPVDGPVGGPPGVVRSVLRWCAHLLDAIVFIGYLRPLWHAERRTVADSIVGTVVAHRPPAPRGDRGAVVATVTAWVVVVVGLAFGVTVGESTGVDRRGSSTCELGEQTPGAPVRVLDVVLVRETEWTRMTRLWPWVDGERRTDRERLSLEASWELTEDADPDGFLLVRTTAGGASVDNEVVLGHGWVSFPVERAGTGAVDVDVRLDDRSLTSCTAPQPVTG